MWVGVGVGVGVYVCVFVCVFACVETLGCLDRAAAIEKIGCTLSVSLVPRAHC